MILIIGYLVVLPIAWKATLTKASEQLIIAIGENDLEGVRSIVRKYPQSINTLPTMSPYWWQVIAETPEYLYPLQFACGFGNYEIISFLVDHGADCNLRWKGPCGNDPPLMNVVEHPSFDRITDIVELLLDNGADVTLKNEYGYTAYDIAVKNGLTEISELIIP